MNNAQSRYLLYWIDVTALSNMLGSDFGSVIQLDHLFWSSFLSSKKVLTPRFSPKLVSPKVTYFVIFSTVAFVRFHEARYSLLATKCRGLRKLREAP